jgi:hypothetical protein
MLQETKMFPVKRMRQKVFRDREIPQILLFGDWLSKAGFQPNDSAMVVIYKNTLLIRNVKNDKDDE